MCGIFGVTVSKPANMGSKLREALKHLEYRGYDSVGIAVSDGREITVYKDVGYVDDVLSSSGVEQLWGISGIGHTRWATHGGVTRTNAHPHLDCSGSVAIVHNGIIENYLEIREHLEKKGHIFRSETDSEVIAHLFEEYGYDELSVKRIMSLLKGSFAFVALFRDGTLLCGRKGSPLVVGKFANGVAIASDPVPLLSYTKKVIRLEDGEYCVARGSYLLYRGRSSPVDVGWTPESFELAGYRFYMEKEIEEQPAVLLRLMNWIKDTGYKPKMGGKIHIIGAGTSYHAAIYGEYVLGQGGHDVKSYVASEYAYWKNEDPDVVIAVSQSGETADVISALEGYDGKIIAITNNPTSTLASMSEEVILLNAGPELGVAATKTYTAQLLSFYYMVTRRLPKELPSLVYETLVRNKAISESVSRYLTSKRSAYYLGRGLNYITAREGALKLKEVAYIHAEAYPAGESKHGPISLVEKGFPVIFILPKDRSYQDTLSNLEEMLARGSDPIVVGNEPIGSEKYFISIPYVRDDRLYPIITVIPLQLLALNSSILKGFNPDRPRNLAKSVTVK